MSNLLTRAITGLIYVAGIIAIFLAPANYTTWVFALILLVASNELKRIVNSKTTLAFYTLPVYFFFVLPDLFPNINQELRYLFFIFPIAEIISQLLSGKDSGKQLQEASFAIIYLVIPFYSISILRQDAVEYLLIALFAMIWANDTGAYLVGKKFGKRKLAPNISPKKTIEGLVGGILSAIIIAFIATFYINELSYLNAILIAVLVSFSATVGDLFESALKRKAEIKDSGKLFVGHGGFLDRFDSVLFAAPITLLYIKLVYEWL